MKKALCICMIIGLLFLVNCVVLADEVNHSSGGTVVVTNWPEPNED